MAQEVYVVIEFDRETDEFSEVEGVFQSKEEAEDFAKECSARYLRYSYGCYEGTYDADEVDAVLAEKDAEIRRLKRALWVTRTAWAKSEKDRWDSHVDCGNKRNRKDPAFVKTGKLLEVSEWRKLWADNESKCRAKAEEYK